MRNLNGGQFAIGLFLGIVGGFFFFFALESSLPESNYSNAISAILGAVLAGAISIFASHMILSQESQSKEQEACVSFQLKFVHLFSELSEIRDSSKKAFKQKLPEELSVGQVFFYCGLPKSMEGLWLSDAEISVVLKYTPFERKVHLVLMAKQAAFLLERHNYIVAERRKLVERTSAAPFGSAYLSTNFEFDRDELGKEENLLVELDECLGALSKQSENSVNELFSLMKEVTAKFQQSGVNTDLFAVNTVKIQETSPRA